MKPIALVAFSCTLHLVLSAHCGVLYVNLNNSSAVAPYTSWETAATNIQDAVDAAAAGDRILVMDGVYATGGRVVVGLLTNRVAVTKPLTLQSVNGPAVTVIQGYQVPQTTNGDAAIRCLYLANGAALVGFTLTNGATLATVFGEPLDHRGGGVLSESVNAAISNCVLAGNSALDGGGVAQGTLSDCALYNNVANYGGGAYGISSSECVLIRCCLTNNSAVVGGGAGTSTMSDCALVGNSASYAGGADTCELFTCFLTNNVARTYGGGAKSSSLIKCVVAGNHVDTGQGGGVASCYRVCDCLIISNTAREGGGVFGSYAENCLIAGNFASQVGGGAYLPSRMHNCTVVDNSAASFAGGVYLGTLNNCVLYFNKVMGADDNYVGSTLNYCCTTPQPETGVGNLNTDPLLVDIAAGNWRLQSNSPCINAGSNLYVTNSTDLDGNLRITGASVDIGAYESQGTPMDRFRLWLHSYGLATDGSDDRTDPDADTLNNWNEWVAGTIPTNAASALRLTSIRSEAAGITFTWQSVTNRAYFLERALTLSAAGSFEAFKTNIAGSPQTTSFTDSNTPGTGPLFYRVGVQGP